MRGLKRVLVVDDDPATRSLCGDALSMAGYEIETASDGMDALRAVIDSDFDLVLTDVEMPELDGISFYRLAVQNRPALKDRFIFMTGRPGRFLQDLNGLKKKCVLKPFSITELMSHVDIIALGPMENARSGRSKSSRRELRFPIAVECEVFGKGKTRTGALPVLAEDLSRAGLRVRYAGGPLKAGDEISVSMNINQMHLLRSAKVVWTKAAKPPSPSEDRWVSGLRLERPMPVSSIISPLEYDFSRAAV